MFTRAAIKNFKSVRELEFSPRRVNLFIGEPNTGKSNILEALAVFSEGIYDQPEIFREVLRFKNVSDLFFDRELNEPISLQADKLEWSLVFESSRFRGHCFVEDNQTIEFFIDHSGQLSAPPNLESSVRYYRFKDLSQFSEARFGTLRAPYGSNLVALLRTNKHLRRIVSDLFRERGFRLIIDNEKGELTIAKEVDDQLYSFSYLAISETLRRIIFFMAILETNRGAVLLLDEPEANTFPFYTKYLAERIALDESNQFFITTHNPYLLSSIVEKTPTQHLSVFVTRMEKFETKLSRVPDKNLPELLELDADAFFNLDRLANE